MADNINIDTGSGATVATDEISGEHLQIMKLALGVDNSNDGLVSSTNPMPTEIDDLLGITSLGQTAKIGAIPVVPPSDWDLPDTTSGDLAEIPNIVTKLDGITVAEDQAFAGGDKGVPAMVVRSNTATPTASNGDYVTLQSDASGKLWVNSEVTELLGLSSAGQGTGANSIPVVPASDWQSEAVSSFVTASQSGVGNAGDLLFNSTGVSDAYSAISSGDLGFATFASGSGYVAVPMAGFNSISFGIYQNTTAELTVNVYTRLFDATSGSSRVANCKLIATADVESLNSIQLLSGRASTSSQETFFMPQVAAYQYIFEIVTKSGTPSSGGATIFVARTANGASGDQSTQAKIQDAVEAVQGEIEDRTVGKTPLGTQQRLTSLATASSFTVNANAITARIQALTQAVYFTVDGQTASTIVGEYLAAGDVVEVGVAGGVAVSVIEATASAECRLQYYS